MKDKIWCKNHMNLFGDEIKCILYNKYTKIAG